MVDQYHGLLTNDFLRGVERMKCEAWKICNGLLTNMGTQDEKLNWRLLID